MAFVRHIVPLYRHRLTKRLALLYHLNIFSKKKRYAADYIREADEFKIMRRNRRRPVTPAHQGRVSSPEKNVLHPDANYGICTSLYLLLLDSFSYSSI
jgi:hypothetical protein